MITILLFIFIKIPTHPTLLIRYFPEDQGNIHSIEPTLLDTFCITVS